ncbi:50S ribosomal protein L5 [Streptomyces hirsutus]
MTTTTTPRLKTKYREEIAGKLLEQFTYENVMQVPGLVKIVVNMGVGDAARDSKLMDGAVRDLTTITGRSRPSPRPASPSRSSSCVRVSRSVPTSRSVATACGSSWTAPCRWRCRASATSVVCPQQFDGRGNYTFGLTEQVMFHEIDQDKIDRVRGMDITVVTTATNDEEGRALLRHLGFPFKEA